MDDSDSSDSSDSSPDMSVQEFIAHLSAEHDRNTLSNGWMVPDPPGSDSLIIMPEDDDDDVLAADRSTTPNPPASDDEDLLFDPSLPATNTSNAIIGATASGPSNEDYGLSLQIAQSLLADDTARSARRADPRDGAALMRQPFADEDESSGSDPVASSSDRPSDSSRKVPLQPLKTVNDLKALLGHGTHVKSAAGAFTGTNVDPHSAIMFEAVRVGSKSQTVELRYLPLVKAVQQKVSSSPGPTTLPGDASQQIGVLRRTRQRIQLAKDLRQPKLFTYQYSPPTDKITKEPTSASRAPKPYATWPSRVPVEIIGLIAQHLRPRDIRNMRLVCKDLERKISPTLFEEVVVPFTSELYDMVEEDKSTRRAHQQNIPSNSKGKGRAMDVQESLVNSPLPHEDNNYYRASSKSTPKQGLRVFQGFGPHMKRFGIRFDVTEAELSIPPPKKISDKKVEAYHGGYTWPPSDYSRFGRLAKLEQIADETPRMTAALASLKNVREIGLSINSGLGFLSGPDRSVACSVFDKPAPLFDEVTSKQRPQSHCAYEFWTCLQASHRSLSSNVSHIATDPATLSREQLISCVLPIGSSEFPSICPTGYGDTSLWPSTQASSIVGAQVLLPARGIIYTLAEPHSARFPLLSPCSLTNDQKQWLLETGWAQHAFMDSYVLAIADNPQIFHQVTKVTVSKISSGLLSKLDNNTFWDALPHVRDLTLLVSPDWRSVGKDDVGCAETPMQHPSNTVYAFHRILARLEGMGIESIKKLTVGYTSGGEKAQGMFARNANLMPAPLAPLAKTLEPQPTPLFFPHTQHLMLKNCWITPCMLTHLVKSRQVAGTASSTLTLDSVSLTVNPRGVDEDSLDEQLAADVPTYRCGSWLAIIKKIKCRFQPKPELWSIGPSTSHKTSTPPLHSHQTTTLISCGYATFTRKPRALESQDVLYPTPTQPNMAQDISYLSNSTSDWHRARAISLQSHMMQSSDVYLARIASWIGRREKTALEAEGFTFGWPAEKAAETEFDGAPLGGTGRFSGVIGRMRSAQ